MQAHRAEQWENIKKVSQQMRNLAASVQDYSVTSNSENFSEAIWHEINELNLKRQQSLEVFFNTSVTSHEISFLRRYIEEIISLDQELIQTIETVKRHLGCKFSEIDNQQRAATAYHIVQSS